MNYVNITKVTIWVIWVFICGNFAFDLINAASTLSVIGGIIVLLFMIIISHYTKCFTKSIKRK